MMIYEYEVEIQIRNRVTSEVKRIVSPQSAYTPQDAISQALMTSGVQEPWTGERIIRVGPPLEAIRKQNEKAIGTIVDRLMHAATSATPRGDEPDKVAREKNTEDDDDGR
jgi:hypothetical protein